MIHKLNLDFEPIHPSWHAWIKEALGTMDSDYLNALSQKTDWLPGPSYIFNAFSLPVSNVNYLLMGESPYPRRDSAYGYAFWDRAVTNLWSPTGLATSANRATSLRNFIKMLLVANGALLPDNTNQPAIAALDKRPYISTNEKLFQGMVDKGFLLLNASLVLNDTRVTYDAKHWRPFMNCILTHLIQARPNIELLLFGKIAHVIEALDLPKAKTLIAEHPYNVSFITNKDVLNFFKPLKLLDR